MQPLRAIAIAAATAIVAAIADTFAAAIPAAIALASAVTIATASTNVSAAIISRNSLTRGHRLRQREQWRLGAVSHRPLPSRR